MMVVKNVFSIELYWSNPGGGGRGVSCKRIDGMIIENFERNSKTVAETCFAGVVHVNFYQAKMYKFFLKSCACQQTTLA